MLFSYAVERILWERSIVGEFLQSNGSICICREYFKNHFSHRFLHSVEGRYAYFPVRFEYSKGFLEPTLYARYIFFCGFFRIYEHMGHGCFGDNYIKVFFRKCHIQCIHMMYIDSSFLSLFYCIMRTINTFYGSARKGSSFSCLLSECARVSPHIEEIAIMHFCIKSEGFDIVLKVECRIYRGVRIACFENCSNSCLCGLLNPREDLLPHRGGL